MSQNTRKIASAPGFTGKEREVRCLSGARAVRVSHAAHRRIAEHSHDWPNLTLHLAGTFVERSDLGETQIDRPAVILHPAGSFHANDVGAPGLETFGVIYDPAWLHDTPTLARPTQWVGGVATLAARRLARIWRDPTRDAEALRQATLRFFQILSDTATPAPPPRWLDGVSAALTASSPGSTTALAARLGKHPAWLARVWRTEMAEGLQETVRRRRVEAALVMLRSEPTPLSQVASQIGFADQAHMTRCFQAVLGTTPGAIRRRHQSS